MPSIPTTRTRNPDFQHSLLLVHGNGGGAFRFSRCLDQFSPSIRFKALTLPGFHPEPKDPNFTTLDHYSDRIFEELSKLPRPRVVLGTGIGGSLILNGLKKHSELADQLILHAPVGAYLDRRKFPKLLRFPGVGHLAKNMIGHPLFRPFWKRLFFEESLPKEFTKEFFQGYLYCHSFVQMFQLIDQAWWKSLTPCNIPAVILWGARERLLTVDQSDPFLELLPQAQIEVVDHWRHFPMVEQPEEFVRKIEALLC